jgi:hypothetical protein
MTLDNKDAAQLAMYFYHRDKNTLRYDFEMGAVARGIEQGIGIYSKIQEFEDNEILKVLDIARAEITKFYNQEGIKYSNVLMLIDNLEQKILK